MKKLLLVFIFIPLLSGTFVLKDNYETKIDELEQRIIVLEQSIIALEQDGELLNETITVENENFRLSIVVVDGYVTQIIIVELSSGESEIQYANSNEQEKPFYFKDRKELITELEEYLAILDSYYETFN